MVTRADFTPEELRTIQLAPVMVIGAAAASEPGGPMSIVKEMLGGLSGLMQSIDQNPSALVKELFENFDDQDFDSKQYSDIGSDEGRRELMAASLPAARAGYDLVLEKGSPDDATAYAQAILTAAEAATKAAKTGSFLGFGGTQVTASEADYVKSLADTLGFKMLS